MWLDLIGIVFLGVFMLTGLLRGTLMSLVRIVTIVLAYAAAMWAAPRFGAELGQRLSLPGPIGMSLMGTLAFVGAYVEYVHYVAGLYNAASPAKSDHAGHASAAVAATAATKPTGHQH